ncbi:NRDE family protein [Nonomuraea soli]|uniref:NRDE family protein n=1 Tax=Nonomuraea soli TaxID=1032476 RepID=A0A7W0CRW7_9ACTN|nr:NRDE family protein [Nonomuraea soli]MBA2896060.1 hypothetical protein [Nonomuraea soli]
MCTVIIKPGLLMGIRDELADRPWEGPGEHWPEQYPGVLGGRDLKAGGTWLAVLPHGASWRVAALLNNHGVPAPDTVRVSRGDLPLRAVVAGELPDVDLTRYDPFHLVVTDLTASRLWSWNGADLAVTTLPGDTAMIVNSGLDPDSPRVRTHLPRFRAAGDDWWPLTGLEPSSAADALILRHPLPDGRVFATLSVTLITPRAYEFSDLSGQIGSKHEIVVRSAHP